MTRVPIHKPNEIRNLSEEKGDFCFYAVTVEIVHNRSQILQKNLFQSSS